MGHDLNRALVAEAASMIDGASYKTIVAYTRLVPGETVLIVRPGVNMAEMAAILAGDDEKPVREALENGDLRALTGWMIPLEGDGDDWVNVLKLDIGYLVQFTGKKVIRE